MFIIWSASKIQVEPEWVYPLTKLTFEGIDVTTFHRYDAYLRAHYGDGYTVYPADEDRRIGVNRIEFPER